MGAKAPVGRSTRWRTPWRPCRSRERSAASVGPASLRPRRPGQHATCPAKGERGAHPSSTGASASGQEASEGETHGGTDADHPAKPRTPRAGSGWCVQALRGRPSPCAGAVQSRGQRRSRGRTTPPREQCLEGKPQERDRDGTSPAGDTGSKASRGCETLRAQLDRWDGSRRSDVAPCRWQDAEGEKTSDGARCAEVLLHGGRRAGSSCETVKGSPSL
jgi:hypothetical protein